MRVFVVHQGHAVIADWCKAISRFADTRVNRPPRHATEYPPVVPISTPRLRPGRIFAPISARLWARSASASLRKVGWTPDIIHCHFAAACFGVPFLAADLRIPYVISEHSSVIADPQSGFSRMGRHLSRRLYSNASRVLPVAQSLVPYLVELGAAAERVQVLHNPVDTDLFRPGSQTEGRIVTVSRLVPTKRLDLLLRAVELVCRSESSARLEIIGGGPERARLQALARSLGIAARVSFLGEISRTEVAEIVRSASVFVLSSQREANPASILEAMASGVFVVAPRVGGIPPMIQPAYGTFFNPLDVQSLAEALRHHLAPDLGVQVAAREASLRWSVGVVAERLAGLYRSLIEQS
jgi:glycosyltransferase involved in cell wall biosynthesis